MTHIADRYTKTAVILHWLVALGLIFMLALGLFMSQLPREGAKSDTYDLFNLGIVTWHMASEVSPRTFYFNLHKSIGVTLFVLIVIRVFWRLRHQPPALLSSLAAWEKRLADLSHKLLYVVMVVLPASGLLMTLYSKYGLHWFGIRLLPGLDNKAVREAFLAVHQCLAFVLIALIVLHTLAALKHWIIDRDGTMRRMALCQRRAD